MSTTIEELKEALPPVVFAFLQNVNSLQHEMGPKEVTPASVLNCWSEALDTCETGPNIVSWLEHWRHDVDIYDANNIDDLLRQAGMLK